MRRLIYAMAVALLLPTAAYAKKQIKLNEVTATAHRLGVLYSLGYMREFSEMTNGVDTVFMFREKWVDFMSPSPNVKRFAGWHTPRILSSKSYYRFTNGTGRDSVSDRFNQHFSWSDWIRIPNRVRIPAALDAPYSTDTVFGKYRPTEIWRRNDDRIDLSVNVIAHPDSRRWVPGLDDFFARGIDFERFDVDYLFRAVAGTTIAESNLDMMTFRIESNGRGRSLGGVGRTFESFYVTTYAELYIADRENLSVGEAKRREKHFPAPEELESLVPDNLETLHPEILDLICRVDAIDHVSRRLEAEPDENLVGLSLVPLTRKQKIMNRLRGMVKLPRKGIRAAKYER